VLVLFI